MEVQRLIDYVLKSILIGCFLIALCISHSSSRPTNGADTDPRGPADFGIALSDPSRRANDQESKLRGGGKVKNAAVSYLFI